MLASEDIVDDRLVQTLLRNCVGNIWLLKPVTHERDSTKMTHLCSIEVGLGLKRRKLSKRQVGSVR